MKYQFAYIFTKQGNLLPWLYSQRTYPSKQAEEVYGREREIQLILLIRYESGRLYCRIKCPVNPLPVKGEFEIPSLSAIYEFLNRNGWKRKQSFHSSMFN